MPSGVAVRDARAQLFAAAERVLLRAGPESLTSRAATTEAGVAKGMLHAHFADFDDFLAELVLDRIRRLDVQTGELAATVGSGAVVDNLVRAVTEALSPVAVAVISLITSRDGLRARLRAQRPTGVPLLSEVSAMIADYLRAERDLGRIAPAADVDLLAPMIVGAGHLVLADRTGPAPDCAELHTLVAGVVRGVVIDRPHGHT